MLAFAFVVPSLVAEFLSGVSNNVLLVNKTGVGASSSAWAEVVAVEFSSGIAGDDFVSGVTALLSLCFPGRDVAVLASVADVLVVEIVWMIPFAFVVSSLGVAFSSGVSGDVSLANKTGVGGSSSAWAAVVALEI